MREIVFSADDFGLTEAVNEAVERANREGCLTQASLMVAAPAAADAVRRARALPRLNVGLHLVLVDGDSLLGHAQLPRITLRHGRAPARAAHRLLACRGTVWRTDLLKVHPLALQ